MNKDVFKNKLLNLKHETQETLAMADASTQTVELDQTSVGRVSHIDAIQQQEMALAGQRRRQELLVKIDTALRRVESDDYGFCVMCDEPIAEKRLELDPTVLTCVSCAEKGG